MTDVALPGVLSGLMRQLGTWPVSSAVTLLSIGIVWRDFGGELSGRLPAVDERAGRVWAGNEGGTVDAFRAAWTHPQAPSNNLSDAAAAALLVTAGLAVSAGVVNALKVNYVVQLSALAGQIATIQASANPAAMAMIPALMARTKKNLDLLLNIAVTAIAPGF